MGEVVPKVTVGSTSVLHWLHAIAQCNNSFLIVLCSTILNYIYHLCALEVVASGIDDIIVQTVYILKQVQRSEIIIFAPEKRRFKSANIIDIKSIFKAILLRFR